MSAEQTFAARIPRREIEYTNTHSRAAEKATATAVLAHPAHTGHSTKKIELQQMVN